MNTQSATRTEMGYLREFIETMEMYLFVSDPVKESGFHQAVLEKIPTVDQILADHGLSFRLHTEDEGEYDLIEIITNPPGGFIHPQLKKQIIEKLHELYKILKSQTQQQ